MCVFWDYDLYNIVKIHIDLLTEQISALNYAIMLCIIMAPIPFCSTFCLIYSVYMHALQIHSQCTNLVSRVVVMLYM